MAEKTAITVESISKVYKLYSSVIDRFKESIHPSGKKYHKEFFALKDVSLRIDKGDSVGIIGRNGSGKSTLLKIITGVLSPTTGTISVNGKISALLELGAGFNPELTGLENIYFNASLMGYSKEEIDLRLDHILAFAEIGDFINHPVKLYSSGMFVRLAFAVAINVEPDILIIDEALAVGDQVFQKKCKEHFVSLRDKGVTVLLVTHAMYDVKSLCDKAIYLRDGKVVCYEKSEISIRKYLDDSPLPRIGVVTDCVGGTGDLDIRDIKLYDSRTKEANIGYGSNITVEFNYFADKPIINPLFRISFSTAQYKFFAAFDSIEAGYTIDHIHGEGFAKFVIVQPPLYPGTYSLNIGIQTKSVRTHLYYGNDIITFRVLQPIVGCMDNPSALIALKGSFSLRNN